MFELDNYKRNEENSIMMRFYGISSSQFFAMNLDYQKILVDNFYQILAKRNQEEKGKTKKKTLNPFKRK